MSLSILALRKRNNTIEEVALELINKAKRFYNDEINVILPVGNSDTAEHKKETEYGICELQAGMAADSARAGGYSAQRRIYRRRLLENRHDHASSGTGEI